MIKNTTSILFDALEEPPALLTGMDSLDKEMHGLRLGNVYVLAGLEKSGKTSLLLNWISNMLSVGKKICFVSTEMSFEEICKRLATIRGVRLNSEATPQKILLNTQINDQLEFIPPEELLEEHGNMSVVKTADIIEKAAKEGIDLAVLDNSTTFMNQETSSTPTAHKIAASVARLINIAKKQNIPILCVLHIKNETALQEKPDNLFKAIKEGRPMEVFDDSETYIKKPTLSNLYGGGGILSQVSGAMLLWRPFQKYSKSVNRGESALILDSMRHSESGVMVRLHYDGASGKFREENSDPENIQIQKLFTD